MSQQQQCQQHQPQMNITTPHTNDVLCGRGYAVDVHPGNQQYREIVARNKPRYLNARKRDKRPIAFSIIAEVRSMNPPGRFLMIDPIRNVWNEIGEEKACDKTSQALRETTTAMGGVEKSISTFTPDVEMVVEMVTGKTTTMATVAVTVDVNNGSKADGDEGCSTAGLGADQKEGVERTAGTTTTFILDTEKKESDTTTGMPMTTGMPTSMMAETSTTKSFTPIIVLLQQQVRAAKKRKIASSKNISNTKKLKVADPTTKETGQDLIDADCSRVASFDQLTKSNWGSSKSTIDRQKHSATITTNHTCDMSHSKTPVENHADPPNEHVEGELGPGNDVDNK
jgi:hypothetical protein